MDNKEKFYLHSVFYNLIYMTLSGAVIQTFFLEKGISENNVNIFLSVMQIIQIVSIFMFQKKSDELKNIIKVTACVFFLTAPFCALLIILSFFDIGDGIYVLMYITGIICNVAFGIYSILSYKFPYLIIDMKEYGKMLSVSGIIIGVVCTLFSALLSFLQEGLGYFHAMKIIYLATLLFLFAYVIITFSFKSKYKEKVQANDQKISLLKYKPFLKLIVPNLLRGFSLGVMNIPVTIGYYLNLLDSTSAGMIVIITNVVTVIGCFVYSQAVNKIKDRSVILISSIAVCVFMPLMVIGNTLNFLIFYTVAYFFVILINYSVPVAVTKIADYSVMGQYSAGRMLLNTLGTSLAGFLCIGLMERTSSLTFMLFVGALQLLSGAGYYFYMKKEILNEDNL